MSRGASDQKLQIIATPLNKGLRFQFHDAEECLMGSKWHYKDPLVKIAGKIITSEQDSHIIHDLVISVLIKTVPEFSKSKEEAKKKRGVFIYEM